MGRQIMAAILLPFVILAMMLLDLIGLLGG